MSNNTAAIVTFLHNLADQIDNGAIDFSSAVVTLSSTAGELAMLSKGDVATAGEAVSMASFAVAFAAAGAPRTFYGPGDALPDLIPNSWPV